MVFLIHHIKEIDAKKLVVYLLKNENAVFIKDTNTRKFLMFIEKYSIVIPEIFLYTSLTNKTNVDKNI